jgi:hypothetical protein
LTGAATLKRIVSELWFGSTQSGVLERSLTLHHRNRPARGHHARKRRADPERGTTCCGGASRDTMIHALGLTAQDSPATSVLAEEAAEDTRF